MFELVELEKNNYYVKSPVQVGIVKINDTEVIMIDGGSDKDAAKRINQILTENNWKLKAIYNTHSHADHTGGNKFLQDRHGCKVYASEPESHFVNSTLLEPTTLYGGLPFKELKHKFLMADNSVCDILSDNFLEGGMSIIDLNGHASGMVGFRTKEDVCYIGDAVSSKEILDKYKVTYLWNPKEYIETLDRLMEMEAKVFLPAHVVPLSTNELHELAQINKSATIDVFEKVLDCLKEPTTFDGLLQKIFTDYQMDMNLRQHSLIGSTLKGYLANLKEDDKITYTFENNLMYWVVK